MKHDFSIMLNPANKTFDTTAALNNATYLDYYKRLRLLALSMFEWENLPESMNERFLEKTLNEAGRAVITDTDFGILNLRAAPSGELNFYENPIEYNCWSIGINVRRKENECVYIRNNWLSRSTYPILTYFVKKSLFSNKN